MVRHYCERNGMVHSNLRFSNVYGHPGDHPTRLINAFLRNALKSESLEIHGGVRFSTSPISTIRSQQFSTRLKNCTRSEFLSRQSTYSPERLFQLKICDMSWKSPVANPMWFTPKAVTTMLSGFTATRVGSGTCSANARSTSALVWSRAQPFSKAFGN